MEKFINQIISRVEQDIYIQAHGQSDHRAYIQQLAEEYGFSRFKLQRLFKQQTGLVLVQFILQMKLELAAVFVCHTRMSLLDIAINMGYSGQQAFTRAFRRRWGQTPQQMRLAATHKYLQLLNETEIGSIPVRIVPVKKNRILWYKRYFGPYEASLNHWPKFRAELERLGIDGSGQCYGLVFDDPDITAPENIRYGCAIDPVPGMKLPDCWSEFEMQPSRFVVFTIRSTYLECLIRLRPRVIAWLVDNRESFGTSGAYQCFDAMPSGDYTQVRDMELHISLAN
ncbi:MULTISPECIES: helix-turn-helix domain-containing protein [Methylomonas]|uniref:helix-turn-helix domain-containing protein n=1 Tax=Methylomonas TaxID=416 RepID=UPI001232BF9F|nr:helix-turn-helix domain-containing protein [Methylomonas rhizoryzae]